MLKKLIDLFCAFCFLVYITVNALPGWSEAQQVARSKQLFLICLYKHVCYGSALIGYHITPMYLLSPLRRG